MCAKRNLMLAIFTLSSMHFVSHAEVAGQQKELLKTDSKRLTEEKHESNPSSQKLFFPTDMLDSSELKAATQDFPSLKTANSKSRMRSSFLIKIEDHIPIREIKVTSRVTNDTNWVVLENLRRVQFGDDTAIQVYFDPLIDQEFSVKNPHLGESEVRNASNSFSDLFLFDLSESEGLNSAYPKIDREKSKQDHLAKQANLELPEFRAQYQDSADVRIVPFPTENFDPTDLRVEYRGESLSVLEIQDDHFVVYTPYRETNFSWSDSIFFEAGSIVPSSTIATREAFTTLSPVDEEVPIQRSMTYEPQERYERLMTTSPGNRFVAHRVSFPPSSSAPQNDFVSVPFHDNLASPTIEMTFQLWGYLDWLGTNPDHHADLTVEGQMLPRVEWEGRSLIQPQASIELDETDLSDNTIEIEHSVASDSPTILDGGLDLQFFDSVQLEWFGYPQISNGSLRLEIPFSEDNQSREITIGGFTADTDADDVYILEVNESSDPILITNPAVITANNSRAFGFEVGPNPTNIFITLKSRIEEVDLVTETELLPDLLSLDSDPLEHLVVLPDEYTSSAQPLINSKSGGLIQFSPRAAYNAFNGGVESAQAVFLALQYYYLNSTSRVSFPHITLIGSTTFDPKNYLGNTDFPIVPSFIENGIISEIGNLENTVDQPFTYLLGVDNFPDATVGRIHAKSTDDLDTYVSKYLRHQELFESGELYDFPAVFIADHDNLGDIEETFYRDQPRWIERWNVTGLASERFDLPATGGEIPAVFENLKLEMEDGVSLMLYTGHGNIDRWSRFRIIDNNQIPLINTEDRWPISATFTCLNGFYAFPDNNETLSEVWLFDAYDTGAVANISPVSVDFYFEQTLFCEVLLDQIGQAPSSQPDTIGEIMSQTQVEFLTRYPDLEVTAREFVLFGEPSIQHNFLTEPIEMFSDFFIIN